MQVDYTFTSDIDDVLKQMMRGTYPRDDTPELTHASAASSEPQAPVQQQQQQQQQEQAQQQQRMQHEQPQAQHLHEQHMQDAVPAQALSRRMTRGRPPAVQPPAHAAPQQTHTVLQSGEWDAPFAQAAPPVHAPPGPTHSRARHRPMHQPHDATARSSAPFAPLDTDMWPEVQHGAQLSHRRHAVAHSGHHDGPRQSYHQHLQQQHHGSHQRNGYVADHYPYQGQHSQHPYAEALYGPAPIPSGQQNIMENNHVTAPPGRAGFQIEKLTAEQLLNGFERRGSGVGHGVVW